MELNSQIEDNHIHNIQMQKLKSTLLIVIAAILISAFILWYQNPGFGLPLTDTTADIPNNYMRYSENNPLYKQMNDIHYKISLSYNRILYSAGIKLIESNIEYNEEGFYFLKIKVSGSNPVKNRILKGKIYKIAGSRFKLDITNEKVDAHPPLKGRIAHIDLVDSTILLVVSSTPTDNALPSVWHAIVNSQTIIMKKGSLIKRKLSLENLRVGQRVEVWGSGNLDYFSRTGGLSIDKLLILEED